MVSLFGKKKEEKPVPQSDTNQKLKEQYEAKKAEQNRIEAEKKAAEEKAAAEKRAAEEKAAAEKRAAQEKEAKKQEMHSALNNAFGAFDRNALFEQVRSRECPHFANFKEFSDWNAGNLEKLLNDLVLKNLAKPILDLCDRYAEGTISLEEGVKIILDPERGFPAYFMQAVMTKLNEDGATPKDRKLMRELYRVSRARRIGNGNEEWRCKLNINLKNRSDWIKTIKEKSGEDVADLIRVDDQYAKLVLGPSVPFREFLYAAGIGKKIALQDREEWLEIPEFAVEDDGMKFTILANGTFISPSALESRKEMLEFMTGLHVTKVEGFPTQGKTIVRLDHNLDSSANPLVPLRSAVPVNQSRELTAQEEEIKNRIVAGFTKQYHVNSLNVVVDGDIVTIYGFGMALKNRKDAINQLAGFLEMPVRDVRFTKPCVLTVEIGETDPVVEYLYENRIGKDIGNDSLASFKLPIFKWNATRSRLTLSGEDFVVPVSEVQRSVDKLAFATKGRVMKVDADPAAGTVTILFNKFPESLPLREIPDGRATPYQAFIGRDTEGNDIKWKYHKDGGVLFTIYGAAGSGKTMAIKTVSACVAATDPRQCRRIVVVDPKKPDLKPGDIVPEIKNAEGNIWYPYVDANTPRLRPGDVVPEGFIAISEDLEFLKILAEKKRAELITIDPDQVQEGVVSKDKFQRETIGRAYPGLQRAIETLETIAAEYQALKSKTVTAEFYSLIVMDEAARYLQTSDKDEEKNKPIRKLASLVNDIGALYRSTSFAPTIIATQRVSNQALMLDPTNILYRLLGRAGTAHDSKDLLPGNDILFSDESIKKGKWYLVNRVDGDCLVKTPFSPTDDWPAWMTE